jgi:GNAT superfamily N-acetyltransferase
MIAIRRLPNAEIERLAEIDRSEHISELYAYQDGALVPRAVDEPVPNWPRTGSEHSVEALVKAWRPTLERGGTLLGAFDGETLAGLAIYRPELEARMADLALLHVSRPYRRKGVASRLTAEVARLARADGANRLYVSATPSNSAVGFYRRFGFVPTDTPNAEMFALEPEDIHMILVL